MLFIYVPSHPLSNNEGDTLEKGLSIKYSRVKFLPQAAFFGEALEASINVYKAIYLTLIDNKDDFDF